MNEPAYFEIQVDDVARAVKFYTEIFGWKFTLDPSLPIEYYRIETEGAGGGLYSRPAKKPATEQGTNAYICSMQVENFDVTAEKIMKLGGFEAMPKFAVRGKCWQGYFQDGEGNTFGLFEVDESAS